MSRPDLQLELEQADLAMRDSAYVARVMPALGRLMRLWFRSEVRGMDAVAADGGALMVSNHSGGALSMDVPILAAAFVEQFGARRPLYVLVDDLLFGGVAEPALRRCGFLPAASGNVGAALASGAVALVFPGGAHDRFRPTTAAHRIDFAGRTDYVRTALAHGVPIVPVVSIGGQEGQLHLTRGAGLARLLRLDRLFGRSYLPLSFGLPFGLTPGVPPNVPLPTKIVTEVLAPLDPHAVAEGLDDERAVEAVDAEVRRRMQAALDDLARQRRFPVLG